MKRIFGLSIIVLGFLSGVQAATTYNITSNANWSTSITNNYNCSNCIINISPGVTLTVNTGNLCTDCTITGGTMKITAGFTFKSSTISNTTINAATSFTLSNATSLNNVTLNMSAGSLTSNSGLITNNSNLSFSGSSSMTSNGGMNATGSTFTFSGSGDMSSNGGLTTDNSSFNLSGSGNMTSNGGLDATGSNFTFSGSGDLKSNGGLDASVSNFTFSGAGSMTSNGTTSASNSTFTFDNSNSLTSSDLDLDGSFLYFNDNAHLTASAAELDNGSKIVAGDGSKTSGAYVYFNGLVTLDDAASYVIISNSNNYMHSYKGYKGGGNSYATAVNGNPVFYGGAVLSSTGTLPITVLPLTIGDLSGTVISAHDVKISWTLSDASGRESMQIERSTDATHFTAIAPIAVTGSAADYTYTDESPNAGENDYRIKLTGTDGAISYSKIISVKIAATDGSLRVFPNPCSGGNFQIRFPAVQSAMIRVFTLDGKLLYMSTVNGQSQYAVHVPGAGETRILVVQIITKEKTSSFNLVSAR